MPPRLEDLLMHEYTECYLPLTIPVCADRVLDPSIRCIWGAVPDTGDCPSAQGEKAASRNMRTKDWMEVIPCGDFSADSQRFVPMWTMCVRSSAPQQATPRKGICGAALQLPPDDKFYWYQDVVNQDVCSVASHCAIVQRIEGRGCDYRYEIAPNPLRELRDRRCDNTQLARDPAATLKAVHTDMRYQHRRVQLCDQYGMQFRDILTKQDGKKSL